MKDSDNKLLDIIVDAIINISNADGIFVYINYDDMLQLKRAKIISKNIDSRYRNSEGAFSIPLSIDNPCADALLNGKAVNILDTDETNSFDFLKIKEFDKLNDYFIKSFLAVPMIDNRAEKIGVIVLINASDMHGEIRPFSKDEEKILLSVSSLAAISMSGEEYLNELNMQIWSFTEALTEAIDERTPYNASHTRQVAKYAGLIADHINSLHAEGKESLYFDKVRKDQLIMAAYLHDIGKLVIPIHIMNKETRLDNYIDKILERLEKIQLKSEIDYLKKDISFDEYQMILNKLNRTRKITELINSSDAIDEVEIDEIESLFEYEYVSSDGSEKIPFLTADEKECMLINKGTLTEEERKIMENHVVMTERILDKVYFNKYYKSVPIWASMHHEFINGTGYPKGVSGDRISDEARILAVADICDALLATDRPYKKPLPKDAAFTIMKNMAAEGKIEKRFVEYLEVELNLL